jgi:hypothetical protein
MPGLDADAREGNGNGFEDVGRVVPRDCGQDAHDSGLDKRIERRVLLLQGLLDLQPKFVRVVLAVCGEADVDVPAVYPYFCPYIQKQWPIVDEVTIPVSAGSAGADGLLA